MNYRHAFHAGNFADVFKHAVFTRILIHLREKSTPFRVIDTHAGAGLYDLFGPESNRSGEWRGGIGRIMDVNLTAAVRALLAPYLDAVMSFNPTAKLCRYPGSPMLALNLMRPQDRLVACELEPNAAATLMRELRPDRRAKVVVINGWTGLNAYVPPKERRGLVFIDPPYEERNEFVRAASSIVSAHRKWRTGCFMLWYPIKARSDPDGLAKRISRAGIAKVLRAELLLMAPHPDRLTGAGLIVISPPWTLESELGQLLPELASALGQAPGSGFTLDWLAGEK
jgi:23S rRNA (adenine2030-N6)-methyltransferase